MGSIGMWAILAGVALLVVVGMAGVFKPRRKRTGAAAIVEECTIVDGAKACTRRPMTREEMPAAARAAYDDDA